MPYGCKRIVTETRVIYDVFEKQLVIKSRYSSHVYWMSASVNTRFLRNVSCFFLGYWLSAFRVIDDER